MNKKILAALTAGVLVSAVEAAAQDIKLPDGFNVFFSNAITAEAASTLRFEDKVLVLENKSVVQVVKLKRQDGLLDLRQACPDKKIQNAAAVTAIYAEKPGKLRIGMGADWWFDCYCNGRYIFGTGRTGNGTWPAAADNYIFELPLRAGRNDISIFIRSGAGGWTLAFGEPPQGAELHQKRYEAVPPGVLYGPYLTNPGSHTATVSYVVQGRQPVELEYRKKGNKVWKKLQLLRGGQLRSDGPVMRFDLKDLAPDTVYEYRALRRVGDELRISETDEVRTFKTFTAQNKDHSFWIMADTQATKKLVKLSILEKLLKSRPDLRKADMFVHLGDIASNHDDIQLTIFDAFLKKIPAHQFIVPLRGNHEFDGAEAGDYLKYLGSREGRSYQAFRRGNVFFIVLDTGHHLPKDSQNSFQRYTGLNELDTLLEEQTAWLKEVVKSKDFAEAEYRIVFGHVAPHSQVDGFNHMVPRLQKMTAEIFKGSPAKYPVNLWFAGHTHVYKVTPADKSWQFPVMVLGGGVRRSFAGAAVLVENKKQQLYITVYDTEGKVNDKFVLKGNQLEKL